MKLTAKTAPKRLTKTPLLVLFVCEGARPKVPQGVTLPRGFASSFDGKARATALTFAGAPAEQVLLVGLGPKQGVDAEGLRRAAAVAVKRAEALGAAKASLSVDGVPDLKGSGAAGSGAG